MKKITYLSIVVFGLLSQQETQCSSFFNTKLKKIGVGITVAGTSIFALDRFISNEMCNENCQRMQTALDLGRSFHEQGERDIVLQVPVYPNFTPDKAIACRKEYEKQHPGVFQKTPAIIAGNPTENTILIRILSREQADELTGRTKKSDGDGPHSI